jgi:hypothetical protein
VNEDFFVAPRSAGPHHSGVPPTDTTKRSHTLSPTTRTTFAAIAITTLAMLGSAGVADAAPTQVRPGNLISISVSFPKSAGFCQNMLWWKNRVAKLHYTVWGDFNNQGEAYMPVKQPSRRLDDEDYSNVAGDTIHIWAPKGKPAQVDFTVLCARGRYEGQTPLFTATKNGQKFMISVGGVEKGFSVTKV